MAQKYQNLKSFCKELFGWKLSKQELKNQVENYDSLTLFGSFRKISASLMFFIAILNLFYLVMYYFQPTDPFSLFYLIDISMLIILATAVYQGMKQAIFISIIFWTMEVFYQIYCDIGNNNIVDIFLSLFFWAIFINIFYKTWVIEKERQKQKLN